ncbi:hypothetical protein IEO70_19595 [Bacillus sp. AGMB 02131]|uniref:Uncharacterized protein n=1 Tax=Peribacillus faecalis TaxID=2772559 RepID=A0A927D2T1_9BACI|nr:hypothetical protein [Peribacillus faecalis]MBD3110535.1 hypothetical protein [Peribacillus faecalis]
MVVIEVDGVKQELISGDVTAGDVLIFKEGKRQKDNAATKTNRITQQLTM